MFQSKFKDLKEKNEEALSQLRLEDAFVCHKTINNVQGKSREK